MTSRHTRRARAMRAARGYDLLLLAYPQRYRARFGAGMRHTFLCEHANARGWRGLVFLWTITLAQAVVFGTAERLSRIPETIGIRLPSRQSDLRFRWSLPSDVRFAVRLLVRSPLFAVTAVLSLAIGVAASTTIFSLADAILLQASPGVREPDQVLDIGRTTDGSGHDTLSYPMFEHLRDHTQTLESIAASTFEPAPLSLSDGTTSERVYGRTVSANFFEVLGVRPVLGRFFFADEDKIDDARPVVVLSYRFWEQHLESDPDVLERSLRLNRTDFEVIGVAEAEFNGSSIIGADLWTPMAMVETVRGQGSAQALDNPRSMWLSAVARLQPGATREAA